MFFLFASLVLVAGCAQKERSADKIILTSFYPIYIEALNVADGVPGVLVENLTKPTSGCLHDYQLAPEDLVKLEKGDCFIVNGLGMESFLDKVVKARASLKMISASDHIEPIDNNPHVWVSPKNARQQVLNIADALSAWDTLHRDLYQRNGAAYAARLDTLDENMRTELQPFAGTRIVTFHEAFTYFAAEFHLSVAAVIQREPGSDPSAGELAQTIRLIRTAHVTALFAEPQYSSRSAATLSEETGVPVYTLDPAVSGPLDKEAYLTIMRQNLQTLRKALR